MQTVGMKGLISVIVPCHNKADFVVETLDSVLEQQNVSFEVIVIDDFSTDGSWEIISGYRDRVHAERLESNRGSTYARNRGAALARGEALMFLDADDLLRPGTLHALYAAVSSAPGVIAACPWKKLHPSGEDWETGPSPHPLGPPGGDHVRAWLAGWYFPPCAILWSRAAYEKSGGWREMGPWDDAEIMMRAFLHGVRLVVTRQGESLYRILAEGESLRSRPSREAVQSRVRVLDTIRECARQEQLLPRYRDSLGRAYYRLGTTFASAYPDVVLECFSRVDECLGRTPLEGSRLHRLLWRLVGLRTKQRLSYALRSAGRFGRHRRASRVPA